MRKERRSILSILGCLLILWGGHDLLAASQTPPNFIVVVADDLGWGDLSVYGHPWVKTPALDRMARQGTLFTSFYVNGPVCSPTRAALLTGNFPAENRIHAHLQDTSAETRAKGLAEFLDPKVMTLPRYLGERGYATAHFGKWHLGHTAAAPSPAAYGFDEHKSVQHEVADTDDDKGWNMFSRAGNWRARVSDLIVDETIRFVNQHRESPFYVQAWLWDPHGPLKVTDSDRSVYPGFPPGPMKDYLAAVSRLDRAVGRIMQFLDSTGLAERTVLIFTSDNGPEGVVPAVGLYGQGSPGPFRGRKRSLYEGGIRTPFLVRWPGHTPAGRVDDTTVISGVDLFPTFLSLAGVSRGEELSLDGEDMSNAIRGQAVRRSKALFWEWRFSIPGHVIHKSPRLAIRDGRWKLLMNPDRSRIELYDIVEDPRELQDLSESRSETVERLSRRLLEWHGKLPPGPVDADAGVADYPWPEGDQETGERGDRR